MAIDLNGLSVADLEKLIVDARARIETVKKQQFAELRRALEAQARTEVEALTARIRPHFLFNSLNAVLSLIRARPQQAEAALESLSDLFRAAMRDPGEMISLADEIALGKQYFELERLRLGERLTVDWQIGAVSMSLPIPPLMLQPLLENAVYHGIEPSPEGGTVRITIEQGGDELRIAIANPNASQSQHAAGNHIAVANIRERLALYYDLEARLEIDVSEQFYEVRIILPRRQKCRPVAVVARHEWPGPRGAAIGHRAGRGSPRIGFVRKLGPRSSADWRRDFCGSCREAARCRGIA